MWGWRDGQGRGDAVHTTRETPVQRKWQRQEGAWLASHLPPRHRADLALPTAVMTERMPPLPMGRMPWAVWSRALSPQAPQEARDAELHVEGALLRTGPPRCEPSLHGVGTLFGSLTLSAPSRSKVLPGVSLALAQGLEGTQPSASSAGPTQATTYSSPARLGVGGSEEWPGSPGVWSVGVMSELRLREP